MNSGGERCFCAAVLIAKLDQIHHRMIIWQHFDPPCSLQPHGASYRDLETAC